MTNGDTLSFAADIRPMFTEMDVAHMRNFDIDLSERDDVMAHAEAIYRTVSAGTMPPPSSGEARWTQEMCARFKRWQNEGYCP